MAEDDVDFRNALLSFLEDVEFSPDGAAEAHGDSGTQQQQHPHPQQQQHHHHQHLAQDALSTAANPQVRTQLGSGLADVTQPPAPFTSFTMGQVSSTAPLQQAPQQQGRATAKDTQQQSKPRRKRGPTSQQKVAELEAQVAAQLSKLQQLSMDNAFMAERVRMLELVIKVRDAQLERIQLLAEDRLPNPFAVIGATPQELKAASPAWVANKFVEVCGGIAMRLAPLLPVLEQHPDLIYGPAPGARWALAADDPDGAALPLHAQVDRKVLQDFYRLARQVDDLLRMAKSAFLVAPQIMLTSSLHVHAVDPAQHSSWQALTALIKDVPEPAAAAAAAAAEPPPNGAQPPKPTVAPESHWRDVVAAMRLTDPQRLQAAVLHSIIARPLADIRRQRAQLGAAFAQLHDMARVGGGCAGGGALVGHDAPGGAQLRDPTTGEPRSPHHQLTHGASSGLSLAASGGSGALGQAATKSSGELSGSDSGLVAGGGSGAVGALAGAGASSGSRLPKIWYRTLETELQEPVLLRRLQLSVMKEMCLVLLITEVLSHNVLTPMQTALMLVNVWPYFIDDLALLNAAAAEYTGPQPQLK